MSNYVSIIQGLPHRKLDEITSKEWMIKSRRIKWNRLKRRLKMLLINEDSVPLETRMQTLGEERRERVIESFVKAAIKESRNG